MTEGVKIEILDVDCPAEELFGKADGDQAAPSLVPLAEFQDVKILVISESSVFGEFVYFWTFPGKIQSFEFLDFIFW